jgi:hypothetical protein
LDACTSLLVMVLIEVSYAGPHDTVCGDRG